MLHHKSWRWYRRHLPLGAIVFAGVLAIALPTWLSQSRILPFHRTDFVAPARPPWPAMTETAFDGPAISLPRVDTVHVRDALNVPVPKESLELLAWVVQFHPPGGKHVLPIWQDRLRAVGLDAYIQQNRVDDDSIYIGPFVSQAAAEAASEIVVNRYRFKTDVISYKISPQ